MFRATTATTCAAGVAITTGNVQLLPNWAPPIQYVGTTDPWLCMFNICTTMAGSGVDGTKAKWVMGQVRAYGRRNTLHGGQECFATSRQIKQQYGSVKVNAIFVFTYRAIGELVRP